MSAVCFRKLAWMGAGMAGIDHCLGAFRWRKDQTAGSGQEQEGRAPGGKQGSQEGGLSEEIQITFLRHVAAAPIVNGTAESHCFALLSRRLCGQDILLGMPCAAFWQHCLGLQGAHMPGAQFACAG